MQSQFSSNMQSKNKNKGLDDVEKSRKVACFDLLRSFFLFF